MKKWIEIEQTVNMEPGTSSRHYEDLLDNLSDHCKGRIEGCESMYKQIQWHRVENEYLTNEGSNEEHVKLTHQ